MRTNNYRRQSSRVMSLLLICVTTGLVLAAHSGIAEAQGQRGVNVTAQNESSFIALGQRAHREDVVCHRGTPGYLVTTARGTIWRPVKRRKLRPAKLKSLRAACRALMVAPPAPAPKSPTATPLPPTSTPAPADCVLPPGTAGIQDENDLLAIESQGNYQLCADITMSPRSEGLLAGQIFQGSLDGNGHTIHGLSLQAPNQMMVGLFQVIGRQGRVSNLSFSNPAVTAQAVSGVVAAINGGTVSNISITGGRVEINALGGALVGINAGGIVSGTASAPILLGGASIHTLSGISQ